MDTTDFVPALHPWDLSPDEAIGVQRRLSGEVIRRDQIGKLGRVAGLDVGFESDGEITRAAVVVLSFPELQLLESAIARRTTSFPYIPGLLSFREAPAILDALTRLNVVPDLLLVDGQGIAHPRRLGIASHLGVVTGLPSIGVAKSILVGRHEPVPNEPGAWRPLIDRTEAIGAALRTRAGVKPVYVSIGHRLSLETAIELVLRCTRSYRLPEPIRQAHHLASQKRGEFT
jgi:deoxyribonuclease V